MSSDVNIFKDLCKVYNKRLEYITDNELYYYFTKNNISLIDNNFLTLESFYKNKTDGRIFFEKYRQEFLDKNKLKQNNTSKINKPSAKKNQDIDKPNNKRLPKKFQEAKELLQLRRYSFKTINNYLSTIKRANIWFLENKNVLLDDISAQMAKEYFLYLTNEKKVSYSTIRGHRFSIEFYFVNVLSKDINLSFVKNVKKKKQLPDVLTHQEINDILFEIKNQKHWLMVSLLYAAGLRISEVLKLKVKDLNLEEAILLVKEGKGKKDRNNNDLY